jgi:hypothetical protein
MKNLLPKEGAAPEPLVHTPRLPVLRPPEKQDPPTLLSLVQFAAARKLKLAKGGFESECKQLGNTGKRTLKEWDELFASYWNRPVRG